MIKKGRKSKRLALQFSGIILTVIALIIVILFSIKYINFSKSLVKIPIDRTFVTDVGKLDSNPNDKITNIALIASEAPQGFENADATMILSINKDTKKVKILSLLEDISLILPDGGSLPLDQTLSEGGPELTLKTLNYNFDLNIDKFIYIKLDSLPQLVDKIGGVDVKINAEDLYLLNRLIFKLDQERGSFTDQFFKGGSYNFDGIQALAYCQFDGAKNHKEVIGSIFNKCGSNISDFAKNISPLISTNMKASELMSVISSANKVGSDKIESIILPLDGDLNNGLTGADNRIINIDATKDAIHDFITN